MTGAGRGSSSVSPKLGKYILRCCKVFRGMLIIVRTTKGRACQRCADDNHKCEGHALPWKTGPKRKRKTAPIIVESDEEAAEPSAPKKQKSTATLGSGEVRAELVGIREEMQNLRREVLGIRKEIRFRVDEVVAEMRKYRKMVQRGLVDIMRAEVERMRRSEEEDADGEDNDAEIRDAEDAGDKGKGKEVAK